MSVIYINSYQFAAPAGPTDPYFSDVSLLLHGDGTNGSTTFVDSSSNNFTVTPSGNAQISTAQSKFGGASMLFDGSGDYLTAADNAEFDLGAADFTVECWYYFSANLSGFQPLIAKNAGSAVRDAWVLQQNRGTANKPAFLASSGTTTWDVEIISSVAANLNAWNHIAAVRNGNDFVLYLNGTSVATANSSITISSNSLPLSIAAYSNGNLPYSGYIDDLRITEGVNGARYTSNFTPPPAAFPDI